jgi:hypothetical protein
MSTELVNKCEKRILELHKVVGELTEIENQACRDRKVDEELRDIFVSAHDIASGIHETISEAMLEKQIKFSDIEPKIDLDWKKLRSTMTEANKKLEAAS